MYHSELRDCKYREWWKLSLLFLKMHNRRFCQRQKCCSQWLKDFELYTTIMCKHNCQKFSLPGIFSAQQSSEFFVSLLWQFCALLLTWKLRIIGVCLMEVIFVVELVINVMGQRLLWGYNSGGKATNPAYLCLCVCTIRVII